MSWKLNSMQVTGLFDDITDTAHSAQVVSLRVDSYFNPTFKNVSLDDMHLRSKDWTRRQSVSGISISVESHMITASMFQPMRNFYWKKCFQQLNVVMLPLLECQNSVRVKFHDGKLSFITISSTIRLFLLCIRKPMRLNTIQMATKR